MDVRGFLKMIQFSHRYREFNVPTVINHGDCINMFFHSNPIYLSNISIAIEL